MLKLSAISLAISASYNAQADQTIQDDLVVVGSICTGLDCVNGESFGFDTIRLKENNLRIRFMDTSSSSSFPTGDWQITINDTANGGVNRFSIEDLDAGTTPFTILGSAPNNSFYMAGSGNIGMGTTTPLVELSIKDGNTPTIRLEQDASSGFAEQAWDIGGNESNFFVRDVTNGSVLPFRIVPSAPNGSLYIAADGDVGLSTITPDGLFDVAHSSDANNHAFLITPSADVGINIDNGQVPNGLFDVQTTGAKSLFVVQNDGDVGVGTSNPVGRFEITNQGNNASYFNVDATGKVGVGTNTPDAQLHVVGSGLLISDSDIGSPTAQSPLHLQYTDEWQNYGFTIENVNDAVTGSAALSLQNKGSSSLSFMDNSSSPVTPRWTMYNRTSGNFIISSSETTEKALILKPNGNLILEGDITAKGTLYSSSENLKENFINVDTSIILSAISKLKILNWNYKTDSSNVRHMGPMAEDFHKSFALNGSNDIAISSSDVNGITLAAIQELNKRMQDKDDKIKALTIKVNKLLNKIK
jgi:hypothetical protein